MEERVETTHTIRVHDQAGNLLVAHLRWGEADISCTLYKVDGGPLIFLAADGNLTDSDGNRYTRVA